MRDERGWSQEKAGEALGKPQSVISRYESPDYGRVSLQTLREIASGYDVGLLIKFVPFSRLVQEYEDVSAGALSAKSLSDPTEAAKLQVWATEPAFAGGTIPLVISGPGTGKAATFLAGREPETIPLTMDDITHKPYVIARGVPQRGTQAAVLRLEKKTA
jgi:transcriptional regulator with XRE-family HTH domain